MFWDISKTLMLGVRPPEFLKLRFLKPAPGGNSYWSPNTTTNSETSPSAYRLMFFRMFPSSENRTLAASVSPGEAYEGDQLLSTR